MSDTQLALLLAFEDATTTGTAHPATSHAAARDALPRSGTARYRVLVSLLVADRTDEEIQDLLHMGANTQRPRRVELARAGLIEDSRATRRTRAGSQSIVWRVTAEGRAAAAREYLGYLG